MLLSQLKVDRAYVVRLGEGDELITSVEKLAAESNFKGAFFVGIGAFKRFSLGFFKEGKYVKEELALQVEVASCTGNVSLKEGKPFVHCHVVLRDESGKVYAGHLFEGMVYPTFELLLLPVAEAKLVRKYDPATNLFLLDVER